MVKAKSALISFQLGEAKRRYRAHFISKLTDCDGENSETESSLDFGKDCAYINEETHKKLVALNHEVGKMLGSMIKNPTPFIIKTDV